LLFAILAAALSGCSTLGSGLRSDSALLAGTVPAPDPSDGPEHVSAALAAETRGDTDDVVKPASGPAPVAFAPAAFAPIQPEAQAWVMVASAGPLARTAMDPVVGQRGTPAPPPDPPIEEYDPWEPFNEKMFAFNYNLDRYVLKPVAKGYNFVMPDMFQQMVDNGFENIKVVQRVVNNLLQAEWKGVGIELGRFLINSTLGIGGLFDIARQEFGLQKTRADFGQTLGVWGIKPGPYLVLPFLPPMTVRDGIGTAVDGAMDPLSYVLPFIWDRLGMRVGNTINDRSLNLDFYEGIEETTVDLYSAVRNAYLQRRENLIRAVREKK
jgi:phospholipid-binding lipoprotein MlaA